MTIQTQRKGLDDMRRKYYVWIAGCTAVICLIAFLLMRSCGKQPEAEQKPEPTQSEWTRPGPVLFGRTEADDLEKAEEPAEAITDTSGRPVGAGRYNNGKVWTVKIKTTQVSVGVKSGWGNAIYLNPICSTAKDRHEVGFYVSCSRGMLSTDTTEGGDADEGANEGETNFIIQQWLYNDVVPASYRSDEKYGLCWYDDMLTDGTIGGADVFLRAVNLKNGKPIGVFRVEISRNDDTGEYAITGFFDNDVLATGELTENERKKLLDDSIEFFLKRDFLGYTEDEVYTAIEKGTTIVEHVSRPYFPSVFDASGKGVRSYKFSGCKHSYAVTFPLPGFGGMYTSYFAPAIEIMGLEAPTNTVGFEEEMRLELYGYDGREPFNEATMIFPVR